jgi:chromosome segregation ATPase
MYNELISSFDSHLDFLEKRIESLQMRKKSVKDDIEDESRYLVELKNKASDINQDIDDTKTELKEYKESIKNKQI